MLYRSQSFSTPLTPPPDTASTEKRPRESSTYLANRCSKIHIDINLPGLVLQVSAFPEVASKAVMMNKSEEEMRRVHNMHRRTKSAEWVYIQKYVSIYIHTYIIHTHIHTHICNLFGRKPHAQNISRLCELQCLGTASGKIRTDRIVSKLKTRYASK
jgi:hypothetical protein